MANETDLFRFSVALPEGSAGDTFHLLLNSAVMAGVLR